MTNDEIFNALRRPFPARSINWRPGAVTKDRTRCIALAFIDARDVMQRLNDVVGFNRWQCRYPIVDSGLVICEVGLELDGAWIWKANGAGESDIEGKKGSCSDAFKRAAVLWGVGQYLYSLPDTWVPYDDYKKEIPQPPALPAWATPEGFDLIIEQRSKAA